MQVELSSATQAVLKYMFETAKKRGDADVRYLTEPSQYVDTLLTFGIERKQSEWKARDKQNLGKMLRVALEKVQGGKPLSKDESQLVEAFRVAATAEA